MDEAGEGAKGFGEKSVEALDAVESVLATAGIAKALGEIKDAYMDCINTAGDFEASMSNVEALSGASGDELESLSDKAKEMGATTKFTAVNLRTLCLTWLWQAGTPSLCWRGISPGAESGCCRQHGSGAGIRYCYRLSDCLWSESL